MKKEQVWNIVLIISIILIIHGLTKTGSSDKKEAQVGQEEATLGTVGVVGSTLGRKRLAQLFIFHPAVMTAIIAAFALWTAPSIFTKWRNLFTGGPTIPTWIYIAGFLVLMFMVMRRR